MARVHPQYAVTPIVIRYRFVTSSIDWFLYRSVRISSLYDHSHECGMGLLRDALLSAPVLSG